jgi:hypothetical protein
MQFRNESDKGTASNFVQMSEKYDEDPANDYTSSIVDCVT